MLDSGYAHHLSVIEQSDNFRGVLSSKIGNITGHYESHNKNISLCMLYHVLLLMIYIGYTCTDSHGEKGWFK